MEESYLLTKIRIGSEQSLEYLRSITHPLIIHYYISKCYKPGTYYTNGSVVLYQGETSEINEDKLLVEFINQDYKPIYKSINSFAQNVPYIATNVNRSVMQLLSEKNIQAEQPIKNLIGIGGEFISYFINLFLYTDNYAKYNGFTNNKAIATDALFNIAINNIKGEFMNVHLFSDYKFVYKQIEGLLKEEKNSTDILINLSKIHTTAPELLYKYKNKINRIIVVSCNEKNLANRMTEDKFKRISKIDYRNLVNNSIVSVSEYIINIS
jgi:hypothetical protein